MGAIDDMDTFAYFSNYGERVEIQAPVGIRSPWSNCNIHGVYRELISCLLILMVARPYSLVHQWLLLMLLELPPKLWEKSSYKNNGEVSAPQDVKDEIVKE